MLTAVTVSGFLDRGECARVLAMAAAQGYESAGLVGGVAAPAIRRAGLAWLDDGPETEWLSRRIAAVVARANRESFGFDLEEFAERMQVACYDAAAQGHFDWHADIGEGPVARRRKLTMVVQLSDPADYDGGRLQLHTGTGPRLADTAPGSATLFPGFLLHRVTPVTRGRRHSLTVWVHGPPFR
ncbi:MAG: hypothetical protein KatS3mg118_2060 [Paracoccaceae bacterium]|nr:MAG: hypothetical protein KatS3mg118_2060 [Paracoccaceae bacterium]